MPPLSPETDANTTYYKLQALLALGDYELKQGIDAIDKAAAAWSKGRDRATEKGSKQEEVQLFHDAFNNTPKQKMDAAYELIARLPPDRVPDGGVLQRQRDTLMDIHVAAASTGMTGETLEKLIQDKIEDVFGPRRDRVDDRHVPYIPPGLKKKLEARKNALLDTHSGNDPTELPSPRSSEAQGSGKH